MEPETWPFIPHSLLRKLNEMFPPVEISEGDTMDSLRWKGGQRSVLRLLEEISEFQTNQT